VLKDFGFSYFEILLIGSYWCW